ncbi:MAG: site-specific integrase, partial [Desulfovibrio sp.]|nr:site-specific integrase [Desulfovibrio sp.]
MASEASTAERCSHLAALLPQWLDHLLAQRGLSPRTVEAYGRDVENFFLFAAEAEDDAPAGGPSDEAAFPSSRDLFHYLAWMRGRGNTGRTLARRLSALRAFFGYAVEEGALPANP